MVRSWESTVEGGMCETFELSIGLKRIIDAGAKELSASDEEALSSSLSVLCSGPRINVTCTRVA